ncbi:hypothetical protein KCU61_g7234, partial [Aureobasidium melanogenum]
MTQGDESPLFCRDDTPPRSGVPPGYVSIRPLLLQRQQSSSSHQVHCTIEFEDEVLQDPGETSVSLEEDSGTSSAPLNLDYEPDNDAFNVAPVATESDSVQNTSLPMAHDQENSQRYDDESQASPADSFFGSFEPPVEGYDQTVEVLNLSVESGVPPGYQSLRSVMGRRAGRARSPVAQRLPSIPGELRESVLGQQQSTQMYWTSQHFSIDRVASSGQALLQLAPLRPQPRPRPIPTSQPASTQSLTQQQRPILPYVFQPPTVPQTPMESALATPLITKGEARSGTAVYPKYSSVTTTTAEGLYTLTDAQAYWNACGRPQCFKIGCDNNQGIGYSSEASRDEHILNTRFHKEVSHLGYEQTSRGYRICIASFPTRTRTTHSHKMASDEFHKIMADLREREKRLNNNLATLEEESRAYIRDHRELLVAIENDQGPTRPPQHPVAEALNTFHSLHVVGPPAAASHTEAQPAEDEDSLFIPEDAKESPFVPNNAEQSLSVPGNAEKSLFVSEDVRIDELIVKPPPRPKRRVTFSDAPATILGATSPSENVESGDPGKTDEPFSFLSPSEDVNIGYDQPTYTGSAPIDPEDGHVNATQESLTFPVTSDDTIMGFDQPVYTAFNPIRSEDGHVSTAQESFTLPVTSDDTIMGFDQPIYTGFTPTLPGTEPALDAHEFVGSYDPQNLAGTYNPQDFAGAYDPQNLVNSYDLPLPAGGSIEPWQGGEYHDTTAESKLPDHVDSHFVCPYPDCGKLYTNFVEVEGHLEHDHPDWALIKDAVIASDTPNDPSLLENW